MNSSDTIADHAPVALITGGSSGLGFLIAQTFAQRGHWVVIAGRNEERLRQAAAKIEEQTGGTISFQVADVTKRTEVQFMIDEIKDKQGRLDVLVNCVGQSDRGLIETLDADRVTELINQNVISALHCCQAAIELLSQSEGVIINVGSLAAKVSPRYLGGYAIAKHALSAMTGQLRLELKPRGIHVGQINPGPLRRDDSGSRYADQVDGTLPEQANLPGGGARVKGLDPQKVADEAFRMMKRRKPDSVLPGHLRILIAIGHALPRLGDWLLLRFTSTKS